jgi:hypothetical protein
MIEVTAYQCADDTLFLDEDKAKAHDDDLLGQELDGLLRLFELDVTRVQEHRALLLVMTKKRKEFKHAIELVLEILEHGEAK